MSKAVLISIRPKWCELIASGKKTVEVRKNHPKLETPFKCYIYCSNDNKTQFWKAHTYSYLDDHSHNIFDQCGNGKVIGEFICDYIFKICLTDEGYDFDTPKMTGLKYEEMEAYLERKDGFGWHISDLVIYDKPKSLNEFRLNRPPQSWCYVEQEE